MCTSSWCTSGAPQVRLSAPQCTSGAPQVHISVLQVYFRREPVPPGAPQVGALQVHSPSGSAVPPHYTLPTHPATSLYPLRHPPPTHTCNLSLSIHPTSPYSLPQPRSTHPLTSPYPPSKPLPIYFSSSSLSTSPAAPNPHVHFQPLPTRPHNFSLSSSSISQPTPYQPSQPLPIYFDNTPLSTSPKSPYQLPQHRPIHGFTTYPIHFPNISLSARLPNS
jgi:hypothetical protein